MKTIFQQNKPFFLFLLKFIVFYLVFSFLYKMYLNQFDSKNLELDTITKIVAEQSYQILSIFDANAKIQPHENEAAMKLFVNNVYVSRVIEGCNAVSVMILFAAFIFAFSTRWKTTGLFIFMGILVLYVLNIARIVLLTFALYYHPKYDTILHGTVFPLLIYGVVFILWILWLKKYSNYAKNTSK